MTASHSTRDNYDSFIKLPWTTHASEDNIPLDEFIKRLQPNTKLTSFRGSPILQDRKVGATQYSTRIRVTDQNTVILCGEIRTKILRKPKRRNKILSVVACYER